ncbi:cell surface protein SprA [Flammeovirgaceae bacterium KN852]|uniref:Cell surface protein SprA n=2 Tax=Marinigracilibium pacificum TaxID=2729599 RepID=A0A848J6A3_9BACT|nr:cell surface protein SprA [Marinigracilibium pacificum]
MLDYDTAGTYNVYEQLGRIPYRPPTKLSFDRYNQLQEQQLRKDYFKNKSAGLDGESAVSGRNLIPTLYISPVFDRIFGGSEINIVPNGFITLDLGYRHQRVLNPSIPVRQQRNGTFEFDQQISMNVVGSIGEKMKVTAQFDNNNSFDFQNDLKLEYSGFEEDIIKKIEVGNVSLPLSNSLITGGQNLFGVKTQMQFGRLYVTTLFSEQRGKSETITINQGFQGRQFQFRASDYDENRHFLLGQFFRSNYNRWHDNIPNLTSGLNVTPRVEVYILNRRNDTESLRNVVALMDLGENVIVNNDQFASGTNASQSPTRNQANSLFSDIQNYGPAIFDVDNVSPILENEFNLEKGVDFEVIKSASKLDPSEYIINSQLGYITLLRKLQNDEMLAVAYEYTYNGERYQVGELQSDYQSRSNESVIFLKMLRPRQILTKAPTWDLMMKNIYNLNANRINPEDFQLRVIYQDDRTGQYYPNLSESEIKDLPLIEVVKLDQLGPANDPPADGNFDFIEGITIDTERGLIKFPVIEPFGATIQERVSEQWYAKYVFDSLYTNTKADAELQTVKNKYLISGNFQSGSSSEIALRGYNIAEGSVVIYAGGTPLIEGVDYRVNYQIGRVTILNESVLNSGKQIQITYEKDDVFTFNSRFLAGTRLDYRISDKINFGGTLLHHWQRRGSRTRWRIGDEPTRNTKYGVDFNFSDDSRILTRMVDAIPLISTKETSTVNISGEFAQLVSGTTNVVDGDQTFYIDDFESAVTPFNLGGGAQGWRLSSTPSTDDNRFFGDAGINNLQYGYKRAKLAWYTIDNVFYRDGGVEKPSNITDDDIKNHYVSPVYPQQIFERQDRQQINVNLPVFDLAYYPEERGPYNYNPDINNDGTLGGNPKDNFGGITRAITGDIDFDRNNIQYIEFWMLDPFINVTQGNLSNPNGLIDDGRGNPQANTTGGKLVFNLGDISEDVVKDGKHGFENGLDPTGNDQNEDITEWGKVTNRQFLTDAFDNNPASRDNQDVGHDGVQNEKEADFYQDFINSLSGGAAVAVQDDPSADNFEYYLGENLDARDAKILERYKNYNNHDGNTPVITSTNLNFSPVGNNFPDNEDLNNDNSISDIENYYQYSLDLRPGELEVGKNYIVDKVTNNFNEAQEPSTWYLVRIPIRQPEKTHGSINGFKSIKFMRLYMTEFEQPVVVRMAKFQLVGSQWRESLEYPYLPGFGEITEPQDIPVNISVVNIEENGSGGPDNIPYNLPPGISRDQDNTSNVARRLNEQSLQLCVDDLPNGTKKSIYKIDELDMVNFERLKMFIHAHSRTAKDDELMAFIRLGQDDGQNYYQISVPLKLTPFGISSEDREGIWPEKNWIDIALDEIQTVKKNRDIQFGDSVAFSFSQQVRQYTVTIKGRPNLQNVRNLSMGVINPETPDGLTHDVCVWFDELRVTGLATSKGWAATARMGLKLADFAVINSSLRYSTVGFGGIQQRISETQRSDILNYDITSTFNLDKFFPEDWGLRIPMYMSFNGQKDTPLFDPFDKDIRLEAALAAIENPQERELYERVAIARRTQRSINFINVQKTKTNPDAKSHIYDIENFAFSYSFSESEANNDQMAEFINRQQRGSIAYNYASQYTGWSPFEKSEKMKSPWFSLIKDFNINPIPRSINVRYELDRKFTKRQYWTEDFQLDPSLVNIEKYFFFNRTHGFRWDLSNNLSLDFRAIANAIIDEPEGEITTDAQKREIWDNIKNFGRMKRYEQTATLNYTLPLDKIPLVDWVSADYRYTAAYNFLAAARDQIDRYGNTLKNRNDQNISGRLDFVKLYNKSKALQKINTPANTSRSRSRSRSRDQEEEEVKSGGKAGNSILRFMMMIRSANFSYNLSQETQLAGYTKTPQILGMDNDFDSPGWDFVFGSQDPTIRYRAANNDWLTRDTTLTTPFRQMRTEDLNFRITIEPANDFQITLDARKRTRDNFEEIFRYNPNNDQSDNSGFRSLTPVRTGSYEISWLSIATAFEKSRDDYFSPAFEEFVSNREIIQQRLNIDNESTISYDTNAQDVLIPAFLAAYSGEDARETRLGRLPKFPIPSWTVSYNGLSKLKFFKDKFRSISITHGYNSSVNVNNYSSSLLYKENLELVNKFGNYGLAAPFDENGNQLDPNDPNGILVPLYTISQVIIKESFNPLIGVNLRTKNRTSIRVEYKKERNLGLNINNSQVTELRRNDFVVDVGYTKTGMKLPFKVEGEKLTLKNELQFRLGLTISDTYTVQRTIGEDPQATNGNYNFQIKPTIRYMIDPKWNVQFYFERNVNKPKITNTFPRSTTAFGFQIQFSLAQ